MRARPLCQSPGLVGGLVRLPVWAIAAALRRRARSCRDPLLGPDAAAKRHLAFRAPVVDATSRHRRLGEEERTSELKTGVPDGTQCSVRLTAPVGGALKRPHQYPARWPAALRTRRSLAIGIGDPKPLMSGHLHCDHEVWSLAREPRNHWEELDDQADVSGLEVVERRADSVIRIIVDRGNVARASRRRATMSDVFPFWMPAVRPRRWAGEVTWGVRRRLTAIPWLNSRYGRENRTIAARSAVIVVPEITASQAPRATSAKMSLKSSPV